jgi:single-stranded-DNA-specific exonuclease
MNLQKSDKKKIIKSAPEQTKTIKGQKFLWSLKNFDESAVRSISYDHNLSLPIANVLFSKGFKSSEQINSFIFPSFEKNVFNASLLKDSGIAVERIIRAIQKKEKILVFGDYDVDGITSSALLLVALLPLGANINFYLPNRITDGYGLSSKIVKKAASNSYTLIITVDNGITAHAAAQVASEHGIDLIITDHHRPHADLPKAIAIIDANRSDCSYPYKELAGVGIIFKIVSMIYEQKNLALPDKVYELLMLGTVADVAPLTIENRFWVQYGLSKVNKKKSLAINVLAQNNGLNKALFNSLDVGFMLAPQLNALGRLSDPRQAVEFLISADSKKVEEIGAMLKRLNEQRKKIDKKIYDDIEFAIFEKSIDLEKENVIIAASSDWPAGVIGLVAGKLTQNFGRPTLLFHLDDRGVLKGSCRSIPEFDIFKALSKCKDILLSFGGHSFAAGLKLNKENLPELKARLEDLVAQELSPEDLTPKINLDAVLEFTDLKTNFLGDLQRLEPFGNQNEQPVFLIENVTLLNQPTILKDKHVKCSLFSQGVIKPIIFFNRPELYSVFNQIGDKSFHVAACVVKNEWDGRVSVELQGEDVAL